MGTDQRGQFTEGKKEEETSYKKQKITHSCLMATNNGHGVGTESYDKCNTSTSCNPKAKISSVGIWRQKNGRYAAVFTDRITRKKVWLGTFDTVEEASQAYFSKKSEKLSQQGNKVDKSMTNRDQIQQPESSSLSVDTASEGSRRKKKIHSHKTPPHIIGVHKSKTTGRYTSRITNPITKKKIWLGTFGTAEEASQAYQSKKFEFNAMQQRCTNNKHTHSKQDGKSGELVNVKQGCQPKSAGGSEIDVPISNSCNEGTGSQEIGIAEEAFRVYQSKNKQVFSCLMGNVHRKESSEIFVDKVKSTTHSCLMAIGKKSYEECNISINCDTKAKISLIGVRRRKGGKYSAKITDPIKHKQVYLGTFGSIEEASQAYFNKKSEFEKLSQQGNKENKPRKNFDQVQQPESSSVVASLDAAASASGRGKRIDSHKTTTHIVGVSKSKTSGKYTSEIRNPITKKNIWLGTFGTAEEASLAFQSKKLEFQKLVKAKKKQRSNKHTHSKQDLVNVKQGHETLNGHERFQPESAYQSKEKQEFSCLMANARGKESSDECNITTSFHPKAKRSFVGIKRQTNGRYAAVITDRAKHRKVWFGTFDTVEEASQAYLSKKSEFEKLSQQGQTENKLKKNCDQIQQPVSPSVVASVSMANDQTLDTASVGSRRKKRIDSNKTTHIVGVYKSKTSGKYTSGIKNPITKKNVWLGTFGTAEEASRAYQSKKLEFQKLVKVKQCTNKQTHSKQDGKLEKLVNVKQDDENVNCDLKSAGGSGASEEAFHAYLSKKLDSQSSKVVKLQNNRSTDFSAGKNQEGQEDDKDLWMGQWIQLPGDRAVMFSLKLGLPIIDNYGSLLGEFSSLDDLSIS